MGSGLAGRHSVPPLTTYTPTGYSTHSPAILVPTVHREARRGLGLGPRVEV